MSWCTELIKKKLSHWLSRYALNIRIGCGASLVLRLISYVPQSLPYSNHTFKKNNALSDFISLPCTPADVSACKAPTACRQAVYYHYTEVCTLEQLRPIGSSFRTTDVQKNHLCKIHSLICLCIGYCNSHLICHIHHFQSIRVNWLSLANKRLLYCLRFWGTLTIYIKKFHANIFILPHAETTHKKRSN